jgi:superfamily II DNA or RNA helicase
MASREQIQAEALSVAFSERRVGLGISMGVGKTYIGLQYLHKFYEQSPSAKFLVVAPKLSIFKSWEDDAHKFKLENIIEAVTFSTYLSLDKQSLDYDVVILDECHNLLDHHGDWLNSYFGRILGLTGTPPKDNRSEKARMVRTYCPIRYTYITDTAVGDEILNDYQIIVHLLPLGHLNTHEIKLKKGSFYTSEKKSYEYWCQRVEEASSPKQKQISAVMRMKTMMEYGSKERYVKELLSHIEDKCLVFANTQAQADRISPYSYHSSNTESEENLDLFKKGKINTLSCVLQLSEGVTIPDLTTSIIMHSYGNERKFMQRFGRCLRLSVDQTAHIHVLCFKDTVDQLWVTRALEDLDPDKIIYYEDKLVIA